MLLPDVVLASSDNALGSSHSREMHCSSMQHAVMTRGLFIVNFVEIQTRLLQNHMMAQAYSATKTPRDLLLPRSLVMVPYQ